MTDSRFDDSWHPACGDVTKVAEWALHVDPTVTPMQSSWTFKHESGHTCTDQTPDTGASRQ